MRILLAFLALLIAAGPAAAQISNREMSGPPPFGVLLGDVFTLKTRFDVAAPFKLDYASLPKAGPMTYWLDLRGLKVEESAAPNGGTRYEIAADYQTFYAPLEAIEQTVPPFKLVATAEDGKRVEADGASWTFVTSPLRPLVATAGGDNAYTLRPDATPERKSLRPAEIAVASAAAASLLALALLAWTRSWPPFHRRPSRPFATAARAVGKLARSGEDGWKAGALALHRAFDAAAGRRLLGDDLSTFLSARPSFKPLEPAIASFFEASRNAFFGKRASALSADELTLLAKNLAAAERAA